jgi:nitroimidazol reductase NimA-like FMN-containing flavoprotein (pyridoxamine 5'-phosphate oxidase superfamily)
VYLNDPGLVAAAKKYAAKYRSVLVTGNKQLVENGLTLGTSVENGRAKFYLNLTTSFSAELNWEPRVLLIVGTFR